MSTLNDKIDDSGPTENPKEAPETTQTTAAAETAEAGPSVEAKKPAKKRGKKRKGKRKHSSGDQKSPDPDAEEKPKRTPQLNTNLHIRGMLAALQADRPETTYTQLVEDALRRACDQTASLPPIHLARLDPETLRIQAGISADAEASCKRTIRALIKGKVNSAEQAKHADQLEDDVAGFGTLRRTMMRQAAIPMVPDLPQHVTVGIEALRAVQEYEKLESPHTPPQEGYQTCIEILKAYRPIEYDLPDDLRDPFADDDSE
jgi:hypothetical protein